MIAGKVLPDDAQTVGPMRKTMAEPGGTQPGDPQLAARLIVDVLNAEPPPLRLPLGDIAIAQIRNKFAAVEQEIKDWEKAARATAFPA